MLTIEQVKDNGWLIFEAVAGSKAYGLNTASSDTDIRGVFVLPREVFYSLEYTPQVANETNDIVYYELKRFMELLSKNNPNIIELLNIPDECVLFRHHLMDLVNKEMFLSKLCEQTFANYAFTQIKKAYGLEKKIVNPMDEERKPVSDFCYVYAGSETYGLNDFFGKHHYDQEKAGLAGVKHLKDCYNLYYNEGLVYNGIFRKDDSNDVCVSNIPKGEKPVGLLYFNKDGYSVYCKQHREYWDWVAKRNDARYNSTMSHGKNYDAKNMMHVFRLLLMAKEIAMEGVINVRRPDRVFLLAIKNGEFEYDDLVERATALKEDLKDAYAASILINAPDMALVNDLLIKMRATYYDE